jgi:hypothetical protein
MEDIRITPHILRAELKQGGDVVVNAPMDNQGRRGLLVFPNRDEAAKFAAETDVEALEPTSVAPGEIETVCTDHGLALVGFLGIEGEREVSVFSAELIPAIFGEAE